MNSQSNLSLLGRGLLSLLLTLGWVRAATHHVRSARQVEAILKSGKVSAGDTIIWADQESTNEVLDLDGVHGTPDKPITLRTASLGGVVLRGKSRFRIGSRWWVVQGFHFDGSSGGENSYNTIQFRSNAGTEAQHVRVTQCALTDLTIKGSSSKWVLVYGRFNRIDHCHFSGKNSKGALLTVELGSLGAKETAEHRIERNYFGEIRAQEGTDNETIRVGFSGDQNKPARCLIQHNYFVRCDGENEIISNKSSFNTYYANTFRQCNGALVLRHGHHARVEGNYFFGDGAENAGGIRVVDSHHHILNNYLQDLTGKTWNAAFSILGGKEPSGGSGNGYQAVDRLVVAHNTILNCQRSIYFNPSKGKRGPTGLMANNLVSSSAGPLILDKLPTDGMKWTGNLLHGAPLGASIDALTSDPKLSLREGLLRPSPSGAAINAAVPLDVAINKDVDDQVRPATDKDIGADEVVGATRAISSRPLEPTDVGTPYLRGDGPTPVAKRRRNRVPPATSKLPAQLLDLSLWRLTLPVNTDRPGRPDEIRQPALDSFVEPSYFHVRDNAVVFRAHCGGSTTKGSNYPRCELREVADRGKRLAAWGTDDGKTHSMTVKFAITKTPSVKQHVVCAQIHDADDDVLMIRLEGKKLFVERNSIGDVSLDHNYKLGTPVEVKIEAGAGRVKVWYNGRLAMDWKLSRKGCYFKAGCYTQSNPKKGDTPESFGEVVLYRLQVSHRESAKRE